MIWLSLSESIKFVTFAVDNTPHNIGKNIANIPNLETGFTALKFQLMVLETKDERAFDIYINNVNIKNFNDYEKDRAEK